MYTGCGRWPIRLRRCRYGWRQPCESHALSHHGGSPAIPMMPNGSFSRYRVDDSSYETYAATRISADRWCHCCDWQCSDFDASRVRENHHGVRYRYDGSSGSSSPKAIQASSSSSAARANASTRRLFSASVGTQPACPRHPVRRGDPCRRRDICTSGTSVPHCDALRTRQGEGPQRHR